MKIGCGIVAADSMLVLSHFKGHIMAGFGGALKNLGMGFAPAAVNLELISSKGSGQKLMGLTNWSMPKK